MQIETLVDRALIPAGRPSVRHLLLRLEVPEKPRSRDRRPVNLALVLDRSGSMNGEKILLAKRATVEAIGLLSSADRVAITVYDNKIETVFRSSPATSAAKVQAAQAIEGVDARGNTNLCGGYLVGCKEVADTFEVGQLCRTLLLTDGLANEGIIDENAIVEHSRALRDRGLVTSTFGVGADFNERLLRRMAEEGGGNFYFASDAAQIPDQIRGEVQESLEVVCPAAVLDVRHPSGVKVTILNTFRHSTGPGALQCHLGSLVSGQLLNVVLRVEIPAVEVNAETRLEITFISGEEGDPGIVLPATVFRCVPEVEALAERPSLEVLRAATRFDAAAARMTGLELNRDEKYEEARRSLLEASHRVKGLSEGDPEILELVRDLDKESILLGESMDALKRKESYFGYKRASIDRVLLGSGVRRQDFGRVIAILSPDPTIRQLLKDTMDGPIGEVSNRALTTKAIPLEPQLPQLANARQLTWEEERVLVKSARSLLGMSVISILFVEQKLCDNWFSHWHEEEEMAVASLANWESFTTAPRAAFVGYEILLHGLRGFVGWDPEKVMHRVSRGCPFDFCETKSDIDQKLHVFELCAHCCETMDEQEIPLKEVQEFVRAIREVVETARKLRSNLKKVAVSPGLAN